MIRSHVFPTSAEAWNASLNANAIRDGDVLLVPNENRAAVLVTTGPVLIGNGDPGGFFEWLKEGYTWRTFADGRYVNAAIIGIALLTEASMRAAGLGTSTPLLNIARDHGWAGEIPEQERFTSERDDSRGAG